MFSIPFLVVYFLFFNSSIQFDIANEGHGDDRLPNLSIDDFSDGFDDDDSFDYNCPVVCNPLSDKFCLVDNVALGSSIHESFSKESNNFAITSSRKGVRFGGDGLQLTIKNKFENPALTSNFYIMYGKVEVEIKGAFGKGIVSSIYLQSDDLDEIDIAEILGGDPFDYQTNYFIKGNVTTYDRERYHKLQISPLKEFYKYGVKWTPSKIIWYLDDQPVRQLRRENKQGFPTSPMAIKISLWAGEDTENEGTIAWSKGLTNYQDGPFNMNVRDLVVSDYSTGDTYSYGWLPNGSWLDLVAKNGEIFKEEGNDDEQMSGISHLLTPPPDYTEDFTLSKERHGDWTMPHERVWTPTWPATSTELMTNHPLVTDESDTQYEPAYHHGKNDAVEFAFPTLPVEQAHQEKAEGQEPAPTKAPVAAKSELISESWFATTSMMSTEYHFTTLIHAKPKPEKSKPEKAKEKAKEKSKVEKPKAEKFKSEKPKPEKPKAEKSTKKPKEPKPKQRSKESKPKLTSTKTSKGREHPRVIKSTTTTVQTEFIQFPEEHHHHHHIGSHDQSFKSGVANIFTIPVLFIILTELVLLFTSL